MEKEKTIWNDTMSEQNAFDKLVLHINDLSKSGNEMLHIIFCIIAKFRSINQIMININLSLSIRCS